MTLLNYDRGAASCTFGIAQSDISQMIRIVVNISKPCRNTITHITLTRSKKFKNVVLIMKTAQVIGNSNHRKIFDLFSDFLTQSVVKISNFFVRVVLESNFLRQVQMVVRNSLIPRFINPFVQVLYKIPEIVISILILIICSVRKAIGMIAEVYNFF